ncbi:MAG TPA: DUF2141 domain-containing protein [Ideonella sp.]|uniref:DUF2141 domain-containing protein n=1 Tax=Ideonella sp. TaxID=1929293 RepID=UPI002E3127D1|nr:DUF2141 domain-containing protein [Ideonella sp.]HEX5684516.1 DUF2141 domain-containing protein [Ideonella sp.]
MHERLLFLATALAATMPALAAPDTGALTVQATGFAHERGHAVAKLFAEGDDVFGPGRQTASAETHAGQALFQWANLAPGRYAVIVFHDENDNGTLDHNLLRLPAEPLGFSNGWSLSWRSGMPSFDKLQFQFTPDMPTVEVRVR